MIVVVVLPLLEFVGKQAGVVDDLAFQEPVELLSVDAVAALHLPVQPRGAGADVDVVDALVQQMPVEGGAELVAAVGLDARRLTAACQDVVDELDRCFLVAAG